MKTLDDYLAESGISHDIPWVEEVGLNLKPLDHQVSGINLAFSHNRVGLYDQTGTGKSLILHATAATYAGLGNKSVVLMPPVLLEQFYEDFHENLIGIDNHVNCFLFRGTPVNRKKWMEGWDTNDNWPDVLLMTYDIFRQGMDVVTKEKGYAVIMADEAQALRNPSSKIHKKVYQWLGGKNTGDTAFVASTGTPAHTHLEQSWGLIRLITPDAYSSNKEFERLHVIKEKIIIGYKQRFGQRMPLKVDKVVGYQNQDIMILNLYRQARRVEKKDIVEDLPEKIHTVVPVILDPAHRALYRKLVKNRVLEIDGRLIDGVQDQALRQYALQIIGNPDEFSEKPIKNEMDAALFQLLESIDLAKTKVIIFGHYNRVISRLSELLKDHNPAILNGKVSDKDAQKQKFLYDDSCRILVAHPKSAGAGLNLQSVCHSIIFYETPDSPGDVGQAEDRVYRINSKNTVNVWFLSAVGTWAAKKIRQVVKKDQEINIVMGDHKQLLGDLFDE